MKVFPSSPPILRNSSFLFVLQSQPFYQAQLVPMTTISILGSSLARVEEAKVSHFTTGDLYIDMTTISILESLARVEEKLRICLVRCSPEKSEMEDSV